MIRNASTILAILFGSAVTAAATTQPRAVDPVGNYEYSLDGGGQMITGWIGVTKKDDAYVGRITASIEADTATTTASSWKDNTLSLMFNASVGPVQFVLNFTDDTTVTGEYHLMGGDMAGQGGPIQVSRVKK